MTRRNWYRRDEGARDAAEWFYGTHGGRVPEGRSAAKALAIEAALQSIAPFHRGALSLWYGQKSWPEALHKKFDEATSLVVRLECALHPATGMSTEALEAASVERLCARIARGSEADKEVLSRLGYRAHRHFALAVRALAKARLRQSLRAAAAAPVSETVMTAGDAEEESA